VIEKDQIDRAAFISKAEAYFKTFYKGANLTLYESIRATA
jgi:TRAP-type transport system periplasmic protein